jgi:hypothetical protein
MEVVFREIAGVSAIAAISADSQQSWASFFWIGRVRGGAHAGNGNCRTQISADSPLT